MIKVGQFFEHNDDTTRCGEAASCKMIVQKTRLDKGSE
jgi:hypothetical protein